MSSVTEAPLRVLQLVDSLALGGLERIAVDLANLQAQQGAGLLCASRDSGPLEAELTDGVDLLRLERTGRWDLRALSHLARWIDEQRVDLIHAHGSSLLLANLVRLRSRRRLRLVWHDHYGRWATHPRSVWLYRVLTWRVDAVIAVNQPLRRWAVERLRIPEDRCRYIPNAVNCPAEPPVRPRPRAGEPVQIVCVANLRLQKDHETLLRAVALLQERCDRPVRLQLIGGSPSPTRREHLEALVHDLELQHVVQFLGARNDVPELLRGAHVGVLSSTSEGLPLALLEYGCAALPVVCTAVGQIPDVLGGGENLSGIAESPGQQETGLLVPVGDASSLADALRRVVEDPAFGRSLGRALFERVKERHDLTAFHDQVDAVYRGIDDLSD